MATRREYIIGRLKAIVKDEPTAELVLECLEEEGVLHLGYGDADIDRIVEQFTLLFGTTKTSKYDRFAASRLAKKYSPQAVVGIITALASAQGDRFAPVVNTLVQLEEKMPSVLNFLRNKHGELEIVS